MVSHCSTAEKMMHQNMQLCANTEREDDCEPINMDVNNLGFNNWLCKYFMQKEMHLILVKPQGYTMGFGE